MNKRWLVGLVSSLLAMPFVHASLNGRIRGVFNSVVEIGSLNFLGVPNGSMLLMFTRFLVGILVFTIMFALSTFLGGNGKQLQFLKRNHAIVISACIALITMIFLPVQVLLAAGGSLGVAVGMALVAGPIVGIILVILAIPGKGKEEERGDIFIKLILCMILFWMLTAMNYHVGVIG
ncbi:hypothetical protein HOA92_02725 [archaeon]|jgi:hypothetical protein|nr:hypothetical protein [archaeon]MBT6761929.1 hypothetical protein [archaeon]